MTRSESIDKLHTDPGELTMDDLFALHSSLDEVVRDTRQVMGTIDEEIGKRERASASARRADPRLTQKVGHHLG